MNDKKRKPYCRPEIQRVKLVTEEAVLGGCKLTTGTGIGTDVVPCSVGVTDPCLNDATS